MLQLSINKGNSFINVDSWVILPMNEEDPRVITIFGKVSEQPVMLTFHATGIDVTYHLRKKRDIHNTFVVFACETRKQDMNETRKAVLNYLQYLSFHENGSIKSWKEYVMQDEEYVEYSQEAIDGVEPAIQNFIDERCGCFPHIILTLTASITAAYPNK